MNKVFLSGRITSDISRFGTDSKGGVSFSLVTSKPVIKDGQIQKDENGYTETYDEFHTVKAFNGLGTSVANHKKKGDKLMVVGDRKSVVEGKSVSVRVDLGGRRIIKKKKKRTRPVTPAMYGTHTDRSGT